VKTRLIILFAVCALLGARLIGVHLHVLAGAVADGSAQVHLAQADEDGDVSHATEIELIGKNLSPPLLPLPIGGGLLLLLMLLPLSAAVRIPRAPAQVGRWIDARYRLGPPSQAPPR